MNAVRIAASLRLLREQPQWQLLAALKAAPILAVLRAVLLEGDSVLAGSVLTERIARELDALRESGEDLPQTAQAYVADWLRQGWLVRRLPDGASEETYELSADAVAALRYIGSLLAPKTSATESRLATVIDQITKLAEETDAQPERRIAALQAERDRIDREIAALRGGVVHTLPADRALERAREVIRLADELAGDFRRVRDDFDRLNRSLRQSLVENDGSRGEVLEQLFAGIDVIGQSDAGRAFAAFWRLLTDPLQSSALFDALEAVIERPFARQLTPRERRFLLGLTATLMNEGGGVHDVLQNFARSLKAFVQSREFREQRRLHALLKEATQAALQVKEAVRPNQILPFTMTLTSGSIRSASQWQLYDPAERVADASMDAEVPSELSLEAVVGLSASASRQAPSEDDRVSGVAGTGSSVGNRFKGVVTGRWDLDLQQRLALATSADAARRAESRARLEDTRRRVAGDVALRVLQIRSLQARLQARDQALEARRGSLALAVRRHEAGLIAAAEPARLRTGLLRDAAGRTGLERELVEGLQALASDLDLAARSLRVSLDSQAAEGRAACTIEAGQPGDLLTRRADLLAAYQAVVAASAERGVSEAARRPSLVLDSTVGWSAVTLSGLSGGGAVLASLGAMLDLHLFDFGRIEAEVDRSRASEREAWLKYRAAARQAVAEVEAALAGLSTGQEAVVKLDASLGEQARAVESARQTASAGVGDPTQRLEAEYNFALLLEQRAEAWFQARRAEVLLIRNLGRGS